MTNPNSPAGSQQAAVDAALVVLKSMGLSLDDLTAAPRDRAAVPTFADYVPVVAAAVTDGTRRAYGSYWNRVVDHWGARRLDEPTPSEIRHLMTLVKASAVQRRNSRGGRSSQEHLVAALRCLYRHAEDDGLIGERDNPARKVDKPRRLPSTRRAVADTRLAEINQIAATTGDDPELDALILRLHTETACRRGGALALRPDDLDPVQCLILLREKGETVRWQPVSPTLMAALVQHAAERHAPPDGRLLRYRDGRPVTYRRYDGLWVRIGRHLPWVRTQQISTHWIRHTTLTWVERNFGFAIAHAYAGHTDGTGDTGSATPQPTESDDDMVFDQATNMLWNPLVGPALRAALYNVLATTPGVQVNADARDLSGRPAIEISRPDYTVGEVVATFEDPSNASVLELLWDYSANMGVGTVPYSISGLYLSVTSTNTLPRDPYRN
jgi:integrase/recombinase XerC